MSSIPVASGQDGLLTGLRYGAGEQNKTGEALMSLESKSQLQCHILPQIVMERYQLIPFTFLLKFSIAVIQTPDR